MWRQITFFAAGFAVLLLTDLGQSRPPGHRHITVPSVDNPQHLEAQGENVGRLWAAPSGDTFVQRQGGAVDRFDASGARLWRISLRAVRGLPAMEITDSGVNDAEEMLLVGVTKEMPPRMAVYRLSGRDAGPRLEALTIVPEMEPAAIAATSDGGCWIAAVSVAGVNQALSRHAQGEAFEVQLGEPRLHRYDRDGRLVESHLPLEAQLDSVDQLRRLLKRLDQTRLALDPDGNLYLYEREAARLHRFDSAAGTLSDGLPLPFGGFERAVITDLAFVNPNLVLYSLFQLNGVEISGHQVRLLDLARGDSATVQHGRQQPEGRLELATLDRAAGSAAFYAPLRFDGVRRIPLPEWAPAPSPPETSVR